MLFADFVSARLRVLHTGYHLSSANNLERFIVKACCLNQLETSNLLAFKDKKKSNLIVYGDYLNPSRKSASCMKTPRLHWKRYKFSQE